jgi:hypothetical protein
MSKHLSLKERFESKIDKKGDDDCWNWTASKTVHGYGQFRSGNTMVHAHRYAYELTHGKIPDGLCVLHICDNPACCNPKHLFLGTQPANMKDMMMKGRDYNSGIGEGNSKIKKFHVKQIRELYKTGKYSYHKLADMFKISKTEIGNIINNKTWKSDSKM